MKDIRFICNVWEISSKVYMLQTDLMMCLLRSVGSKQTRKLPLGFFTMMNEFNHSGV